MAFRTPCLVLAFIFIGLALISCDSPEEKEARYLKHGNKLFNQGELEKARVEYKNAARIKPADPNVDYRLGLIDEAEGNYDDAFAGFIRAEQEDAHFHPAVLKLAQYYLDGEHYDQAQKRIDRVLADAPNE